MKKIRKAIFVLIIILIIFLVYILEAQATAMVGSNNIAFLAGDINGDGKSEIVHLWNNSNGMLGMDVLKSDGVGYQFAWGTQNIGQGSGNIKFLMGDINGDRKSEVIQLWNNSGKLGIITYQSVGDGLSCVWSTTNAGSSFASSSNFQLGDVNGDGKADIIQLYNSSNQLGVNIYLSNGNGFQYAWGSINLGSSVTAIKYFIGDVSGDGKADIIQLQDSSNNLVIKVFTSNGTGFQQASNINTGQYDPSAITYFAQDVNGDNKTDIVQLNNNSGILVYKTFLSDGSNIQYSSTSNTGLGAGYIAFLSGDINGDGISDILHLWNNNGKLAVNSYICDGNNYVLRKIDTLEAAGYVALLTANIDLNNTADLIQLWNYNGQLGINTYLSQFTPTTNGGYVEVRGVPGIPVLPPIPAIQSVNCNNSMREVNLTWNPSVSDIAGATITGYKVRYQINGGAWQEDPALITTTTWKKTGMKSTDVVCFEVRALDSLGNSSLWSDPTSTICLDALPPTGITSLSAQAIVSTSLSYKVTIQVPQTDAVGYKYYRKGIDGQVVCLTVIGTQSTIFTDTTVTTHGQYEYGYTTYNAFGKESDIKWADTQTQYIPNINAPKVVIPNIAPTATMGIQGPKPIVIYTNVSFTLGTIKDIENDTLEYRLYTRTPGTTGNGQLYSTWDPTVENLQVTVSFPDKTNVEWRIVCIEKEPGILDRTEVPMTDWKSLCIDIHYPIPHITNVFNEEGLGTKGQSLNCNVETNPTVHFTQFQWDFGDGNPVVMGQQVTYQYSRLGNYTVVVTAMDDQGITYKGSTTVQITNTNRGQLFASETWYGTQTVDGDIIVPVGITLTLAPGAKIQVSPGCELCIEGRLLTNTDGNILVDSKDSTSLWKGIRFTGTGKGTLTGVTISHAVRGAACTGSGLITFNNCIFSYNDTGLHCYNGTVTILGCSFLNNTAYGIKEDNGCSPTVQNCLFQGNSINYYDDSLLIIDIDQLNTGNNTGNIFS